MEKTKEYTSPYEMDGRIPWPKAIVYGLQHVLGNVCRKPDTADRDLWCHAVLEQHLTLQRFMWNYYRMQ